MKWPIPAPGNFTEGQRAFFGCLVALAGIAHFMFAAVVVAILVRGDWGEEHYQQIIEILGWGMFLLLAIDAVVVVSLSLGGPVGRLKGKAGKDGFDFEALGDGESAVTVTQTTMVTPETPPYARPPGPPPELDELGGTR